MQIGVIADTHSKMRPEALEVLKGSDLILHAGDVGRDEVLEALEAIAPVVAIRGNIDKQAAQQPFPMFRTWNSSATPSSCSMTSKPSTSIHKAVTA